MGHDFTDTFVSVMDVVTRHDASLVGTFDVKLSMGAFASDNCAAIRKAFDKFCENGNINKNRVVWSEQDVAMCLFLSSTAELAKGEDTLILATAYDGYLYILNVENGGEITLSESHPEYKEWTELISGVNEFEQWYTITRRDWNAMAGMYWAVPIYGDKYNPLY